MEPQADLPIVPIVPRASCLGCDFFQERVRQPVEGTLLAADIRGECRRHPPTMHSGGWAFAWPIVEGVWWCGEYRRDGLLSRQAAQGIAEDAAKQLRAAGVALRAAAERLNRKGDAYGANQTMQSAIAVEVHARAMLPASEDAV